MRSLGSIVAVSTLLMISPSVLSPLMRDNSVVAHLLGESGQWNAAIALPPLASDQTDNSVGAIANTTPTFGIDGVNFNNGANNEPNNNSSDDSSNSEGSTPVELEAESGSSSSGPAVEQPTGNSVTNDPITDDWPPQMTRFSETAMADYNNYQQVIEQTVGMTFDANAQALAEQYGLNILNVTWEDTGRYDNSAVGPNISDMTIQVQQQNPQTGDYQLHLMPVIRYPNFTDTTADIPIDQFYVPVGNERGEDLHSVSLAELLGNLRRYLSKPDSWTSRQNSLLADRDTHVLVSAQACFLPVPQAGMAEFNPVLFNYQSYADNPAVLTILATREGTSVTIIDNQRDGFAAGPTWGQRLFFNQNGERASLTGQRISDFLDPDQSANNDNAADGETESQDGLNLVMLIQVPLKQANPLRAEGDVFLAAPSATGDVFTLQERSDVESAVIGHGAVEGPFTEIDGLPIERDPDFPIRVTVQFYKATSNGVVSAADMQEIRQQIARVYAEGDYVGSLVVDGLMGRPTEYEGPHEEPAGWWDEFWRRYEENMGRSREDAMRLWRQLTERQ